MIHLLLLIYGSFHLFADTEVLLGEPIQQAIASESGVELVFDSLADIISGM